MIFLSEEDDPEDNSKEEIEEKLFKLTSSAQLIKSGSVKDELNESKLSNYILNTKLPTNKLPSFDDDYTKLHAFEDSFVQRIDSQQSITEQSPKMILFKIIFESGRIKCNTIPAEHW